MFRVRIDVSMLRERLCSAQESLMTHGDVFAWLFQRGFTMGYGGWLATVSQLRLLRLGEIISSCPLGWVNDRGE
jgi:hypothetical protein